MADINQTAPWVTARLTELGNATNDGLNTLVTSANIGTYDAGNVSGVVAIEHGGTGANNAADAITNLGAITTSDVSTVGKTGEYEDLLNKPTIPTISQTYNASSADGMSGAAVAQGIAAETSRATTAEGNLNTAINTEKTRAQNAESTLNTAITTEKNRAEGAEATLTTSVGHLADNFADAYSASSTYYKGDYVIHDNILYVANQNISTAEAWTAAHWTQTSVEEIERELEEANAKSFPPKTASGDVITITDGADGIPLKDMTVQINPVQAGTGDPSPQNIRTISGWDTVTIARTRKNLFDQSNTTYLAQDVESYGNNDILALAQINTLPAGTYTLSFHVKIVSFNNVPAIATRFGLLFRAINNDEIFNVTANFLIENPTEGQIITNSVTFTLTDKFAGKFQYAYVYTGTNTTVPAPNKYTANIYDVQIELGSTATDYEPYVGETYTIQLGQTVYGGTVNPLTGVLTVTHRAIDMGSIWYGWNNNGYWYTNNMTGKASGAKNIIADCYKTSSESSAANMNDYEIMGRASDAYVFLKDSRYTALADLQAYLSGHYAVYQLGEPFEIQLTPVQIKTLYGYNSIWADTGSSEITYLADPAMYTAEAVEEAYESLLPAFPTSTLEGSVASFADGADNIPIKDMTVEIVPAQAGTGDPSPTNIRAISGWDTATVTRTGGNLFDEVYPNISATIQYRKIKVGNATVTMSTTMPIVSSANLFLLPGEATSGASTNTNGVGNEQPRTVTPVNGYVTVAYRTAGGYDPQTYQTMLNYGDSVLTYEPYTGETVYSIPFGQTVYGGTLNPLTGVMTIDREFLTINGTWDTTKLYSPVQYASDTIRLTVGGQYRTRAIPVCDTFKGREPSTQLSANQCSLGSAYNIIYFKFASDKTVEEWETELAATPIHIVLGLANPSTAQLTPTQITTLLGDNNIWADCGDVSVTYRADPTLYIDGQIAPIKAMVASEESGTTASRAYSAGQYFILDGQFCKALVNIASGATFTLGTNYSVTTIGAELYSALHS